MRRRNFLRLAGLAVAVAPVARLLLRDEYPDFDPGRQYGDFVLVSDHMVAGHPSDPVAVAATEALRPGMEAVIPPEYRNNVAWIYRNAGGTIDPLMQRATVGWKYTPWLRDRFCRA